MPRIDPQQLLVCLTPLLASDGGIKSSAEVIRLANLMEKYSKKLVSKCTYIQILKCTKTELLGQFMSAGGWGLVHTWLKDGSESANWSFVQDILEVLLLCPVDALRLKSNQTPKIVKSLSFSCSQNAVKILSNKLVEQWLKIAHQEKHQQLLVQNNSGNGLNDVTIYNNNLNNVDDKNFLVNENNESVVKNAITELQSSENNNTTNVIGNSEVLKLKSSENTNVKYKISNKDTGLVLSIKRSTSIDEQDSKTHESKSSKSSSKSKSSSDKEKDKKKSSPSSSSSSSSHKPSKSSSSHKEKERSSSSSHRSGSSSRDKHSSSKHSSSSRDKDREKDKEKRKKDVEKTQAEKDKETLSFLTPASSIKMQRIPKRQHTAENGEELEPSSKAVKTSADAPVVVEKKKPSISIEVRKGDKPKTVKTINSQFRNHGLAEEPPPPPSRKALNKKPGSAPVVPTLSIITPTISTSSKLAISPTISKKIEKALEAEVPERVGGVKLIKPKPMLFESTGFLDALDATITNKKDPKKRKRVTSTSSSSGKKDDPESPKIEAKPMKFYNDTSEEVAQDEKTNGSSSPTKEKESSPQSQDGDKENEIASPKDEKSPKEEEEEIEEPEVKRGPGIGTGPDGPPGVLVDPTVPKRKRHKRSIRWRPDSELTEVRLFELDENERCNVTKTFTEQKQMEHNLERNGFLMGRKLHSEDIMTEQTTWRALKPIDNVPVINYGYKSREIEVQLEREKNTLQDLFLAGAMSNSAIEPDLENHEHVEPATIPPEDITGNPDAINDFRNVTWPPPKTEIPTFSSNAFSSIFNTSIPSALATNLTIPPIPLIANPSINPLASLNMAGVIPQSSPWQQGIIPTILPPAFLQAPPPAQIIPNNYQSANGFQPRNNYNSIGGNNNSNNFNNMDRNRGGGNNASANWVRGNSSNTQLRKGTCFVYQKTGFCRKKNNGCPFIH